MSTTMEHPIRAARKRQGLTLDQLSAAVGVHKSLISRVERRLQMTSVRTYQAMGRALGVDWWTLVEDQEQNS